jgi:hypothetical protein
VTHWEWVLIALNEAIWLEGTRWIHRKHLMVGNETYDSFRVRNILFLGTYRSGQVERKKIDCSLSRYILSLKRSHFFTSVCLCVYVVMYVFRNRIKTFYICVIHSTRHTSGNLRRAKICYWWTTETIFCVQMIPECDWYCLIAIIIVVIEDKQINFQLMYNFHIYNRLFLSNLFHSID